MTMNLYALFNTLSGSVESVHQIKNDEMASVYLAVFAHQKAPLDEWIIYKVGSINLETCEISSCSHVVIPFDTRRIKELPNV